MRSVFCFLLTLSACGAKKPNVLLLVADDLGMGDVSCFGNSSLSTPNIDRIAEEGARLSHHLASASLCTPSRASLLTGRYAVRSGMASSHLIRVNTFTGSRGGLPSEEITFAELAKEHGYKTAYIGKWHLGLHCGTRDFCHHPLKQGFDYFYGLPLTNLKDFADNGHLSVVAKFPNFKLIVCSIMFATTIFILSLYLLSFISIRTYFIALLMFFLPVYTFYWIYTNFYFLNGLIMRNFEVVEQPLVFEDITQRLIKESTDFMTKSVNDDTPFLVVVSWLQVHTALYNSVNKFKGSSQHGAYGDNVQEMDWSVGQLLDGLDNLGVANDTFVYFTSDNGGHIEETGIDGSREGGYNGIYRGSKGQGGSEGGIRVPTAIRWPNHVLPSTEISIPTSMMDIFPTLASMWSGNLPSDRIIDGKDLSAVLKDKSAEHHHILFHYCGTDIHAARLMQGSDVYKAHFATYDWTPGTEGCDFMCDCTGSRVKYQHPPILYNIAKDPSELTPLDISTKGHKDILKVIEDAVQDHQEKVEPVDNQYSYTKIIPLPWLQPFCNFPKFQCRDKFLL